MKFQGVLLGGVYAKRKDYIGFVFEFVIVLGVVNGMVLYYPCNEQGVIIQSNKFFNNNFPYIKLNKFVERYEIYTP